MPSASMPINRTFPSHHGRHSWTGDRPNQHKEFSRLGGWTWDEAVVRTGIAKCQLMPRADIYPAAPSVLLDERSSASHPLT